MKYVLDASALLCGKPIPPISDCLVPCSVVTEVRNGKAGHILDCLLSAGLISGTPTDETARSVRARAAATGDSLRLSPADVDALALALEHGATLITDDYSMQNLAKAMGIPYLPMSQRGIVRVWAWERRCRGCHKEWPEGTAECPDCGSEVRTRRKKA